jgi:hypothetical protein
VQYAFEKTALTLFSAVLFVSFFELNGWVFSFFHYSEGISWVFLPAGFRIILVLVLGLPGAVGLMLGSWFIDRELFNGQTDVLAFLNGVVGGFTPWLVMKYLNQRQWLSHQLHTLTAQQLLNLTLIFSAASALTHQLVWLLLERPRVNIWVDIWPMFFGNVLGALLMLYSFKFVLDRAREKIQKNR